MNIPEMSVIIVLDVNMPNRKGLIRKLEKIKEIKSVFHVSNFGWQNYEDDFLIEKVYQRFYQPYGSEIVIFVSRDTNFVRDSGFIKFESERFKFLNLQNLFDLFEKENNRQSVFCLKKGALIDLLCGGWPFVMEERGYVN